MPEPIDLPDVKPAPLEPGTLYLVATPIGNMEDITLRAIRTLRDCDLVAAEDTRHTGMLLKRLGLAKRQVSAHKFNEAKRSGEIIELLQGGSPGISDPGQRLVAAVIEAGCRVETVPGACALVAALTASGLATDEFHFIGFLPVKSGQRAKRLAKLLALPGTLALYESPYRVVKLLGELVEHAPERPVVLARELTKKFEQIQRGLPAELLAEYAERKPKGEFVVLVGRAD